MYTEVRPLKCYQRAANAGSKGIYLHYKWNGKLYTRVYSLLISTLLVEEINYIDLISGRVT